MVRGNRKGAITASEILINAYTGEINRKWDGSHHREQDMEASHT